MAAIKDPTTGKFVSDNPNPADKVKEEKAATDKAATPTPALTEFSKRFMPNAKPPEEDPEKKKIADKKAADDKAAVDKKAADDKKKATTKKPTATATEQALERTTAALEKVVEHSTKKAEASTEKKADEADPLAHLSRAERRNVNVLKQMEKDYPENAAYKGIAEKFIAGRERFKKYFTDWQAAHPGEEFDEEAEEHQNFLNSVDVDWNDDDFEDSKNNIIKAEAVKVAKAEFEEREKALNSKMSEVERSQKAIEEQPKIISEGIGAARNFWKQFGDDVAEVLSETGAVDMAKLTELQKANPTRFNVAVTAAQKVEGLTGSMYKLLNGLELYDKENQTHAHLMKFAIDKEKELLARPPEDQKDASGRPFKTRPEYRKLSEEERKKYWTFSATDFGLLLAHEEAGRAKAYLEQRDKEFREEAAARGIKLEESPAPGAKTGADKTTKAENGEAADDDEIHGEDDGKPHSPSTKIEPKVAANARRGAATTTGPLDTFNKRLFNKS